MPRASKAVGTEVLVNGKILHRRIYIIVLITSQGLLIIQLKLDLFSNKSPSFVDRPHRKLILPFS